MDKKLKKYIESYDIIENCESYNITPNGGMVVLINQETDCKIIIENISYKLESFQTILINAYTKAVHLTKSNENESINLISVRFKGAGASFFYEEYMDELMYNPKEPIFIENSILINELDTYFKTRFNPSKLPFNIMKIIDLLDEQKNDFNIDEVLAIANVPRKILDKLFRLRVGLTFKAYATVT